MMDWSIFFPIFVLGLTLVNCDWSEPRLKVIVIKDGNSDGFRRFMNSASFNNLDIDILPVEEGYSTFKILRKALKAYKDKWSTILMFTEARDALLQWNEATILDMFKKSRSNVLLAATDEIPKLPKKLVYPNSTLKGYKYVSTSAFIGYAPSIHNMMTMTKDYISNDLHYLTNIYVKFKATLGIKLDRNAKLLQVLTPKHKAHNELQFIGPDVKVVNNYYDTTPALVTAAGNADAGQHLNHYGNYVPDGWTYDLGCVRCYDDYIEYENITADNLPTVLVGMYIHQPTPFLASFVRQISNLDYPKKKMHVFIHNLVVEHDKDVKAWINEFQSEYISVKYVSPDTITYTNARDGKNLGIFHWRKLKTDFYFSIDSDVSLTNRNTLKSLMSLNATFMTPMLSKKGKYWSNFWSAIDEEGYYENSVDYRLIVEYKRVGIWNSPYVTGVYLINSTLLGHIGIDPYHGPYGDEDPDVEFSANLRQSGIFMYVTNMEEYGHLKVMENFHPNAHKHADLFQLFQNQQDWEERYMNPLYTVYLKNKSLIQAPCPDVYWAPMFNRNFTSQLIEEVENFGNWSSGGHEDHRLKTGYEAVPTVDIHMNQIGFEDHWLEMLKLYFAPMVQEVFGYHSKNQSIMNFVVKYTMDGQYLLRPHHDASTYTINMALNDHTKEYTGGGARFLRYNCSVPDTKVGWALLHPGRLTHYHEGLMITSGTRYIMISFVDP